MNNMKNEQYKKMEWFSCKCACVCVCVSVYLYYKNM